MADIDYRMLINGVPSLLFDRATMQAPQGPPPQILYRGNVVEFKVPEVDPLGLAPGVVPLRLVGRKPKCVFGLLKSFIGTALMGFPAEPEQVHLLLKSNPSFARVCGFAPKEKGWSEPYHYCQVPIQAHQKVSLRGLVQVFPRLGVER